VARAASDKAIRGLDSRDPRPSGVRRADHLNATAAEVLSECERRCTTDAGRWLASTPISSGTMSGLIGGMRAARRAGACTTLPRGTARGRQDWAASFG